METRTSHTIVFVLSILINFNITERLSMLSCYWTCSFDCYFFFFCPNTFHVFTISDLYKWTTLLKRRLDYFHFPPISIVTTLVLFIFWFCISYSHCSLAFSFRPRLEASFISYIFINSFCILFFLQSVGTSSFPDSTLVEFNKCGSILSSYNFLIKHKSHYFKKIFFLLSSSF